MDKRFEMVRPLGQGGRGQVFLVRDTTRNGVLVALKRLREDREAQNVAGEFELLSRLRHPNLARALDFGEDDEGSYFTSEFIDGPPIDEWARTASRQAQVQALGGVLRALALLHDRDLLHGDLNCKNVLIRRDEAEPGNAVKLLDLGEATRPGRPGGGMTAGFAAPEILQGRGALIGSDLYAFGALTAHVLLSCPPFGEGNASEVVQRQLAFDLKLPAAESSPTAALCRDLLQPDPAKRPRSAASVLRRLAEAEETNLNTHLSDMSADKLPLPRIVQRDREIAAIMDFIERMDEAGAARAAAVLGVPGSGRSTLLEEAARVAQLSGFGVIGRPGGDADTDHLLSCLCRACGDAHRPAPPSRQALAPWMGSSPVDAPPAIVSDMTRTVFAAIEALIAVSQNQPQLILVDDFFRADNITRETVLALARALRTERSGRPRAALLIAAEPEDKSRLQGLFSEIAALSPLDGEGSTSLVSSMLPGIEVQKEFLDTVYLAAKGLPKRAVDIVRQSVGRASSSWAELTRAELSAVPAHKLALLAAVGAVEAPVPETVLRAAGVSSDDIVEFVQRGFWVETPTDGGASYRTAGAVGSASRAFLQEGVYVETSMKLAEALGVHGLYRRAGTLFHNLGQRKAAYEEFRRAAAARLRVGDVLGAAEWFETALKEHDGTFDITDTAQQAVETWQTGGWYAAAKRVVPLTGLAGDEALLLEAALTSGEGHHLESFALLLRLGEKAARSLKGASLKAACELQLGRHEAALSTVQETLEQRRANPPSEEGAQLAQIGGVSCTYLGQMERASKFFADAAGQFEQLGDTVGRLKVMGNMGMLQRRKGDLAEAKRFYEDAVRLARSLGDRPREGLHLMNRATVSQTACNYKEAYDDYLAALEIAEVLGNDFRTAQVEVNLADLLIDMGQGEEAVKTAGRALKRCRILGQDRLESRALLTAGRAALACGDHLRSEQRLTEALRRFNAAGDTSGSVFAKIRIAELYLARRQFERALSPAREAADGTNAKGLLREHARARLALARVAFEDSGDGEAALSHLDVAENALRKEASQDTLLKVALAKARIFERQGREPERRAASDLARSLLGTLKAKVPDAFKRDFVSYLDAEALDPAVLEAAAPSDRWARDLEMLMEINRELTSERDPKRLLSLIMESAVNLTGAERGMLVMPRGGSLESVIAHQISEELDRSFSRSVAEKVVLEGRAVLAVDALGDERFRAFVSVNALKLRSILAVPLKIKRRVVGAVYLDSRLQTGVFTDADRRLLEAFGAQAAVCLETARLIAENQERCKDLRQANEEISALSERLKDKLEKNEAKLVRVGALLEKTQAQESDKLKTGGMVGSSAAMQRVRKLISRIAPSNVPVYIFGASGTGKELAARAVHSESERRSKPFVAVNCGALPSKLLAGELFGHKKGAFTGAVADRPGLFKVADKGTLFLDEVSDMDKEMQTHLLRVLQDGTFRSLGDNEEISVDVRIIAASNRDLEDEVKAGRFREDLFYRLNVVRIDLPSLSARREDIPLLVEALAARHAKKGETPRFSRRAMDLLTAADWQGNVRELENEVLRAMTMAADLNAVMPEDLSPRFNKGAENEAWERSGSLKEQTAIFEETTIRRKMAECGGNASKAARMLGISRATLYKKLEKPAG